MISVLSKEKHTQIELYLNMFLHLCFMLSRQLFMLPLELCDQQLPLELLLVFESHQLVLQLLILVACGYSGVNDGIIWRKQMERNKSTGDLPSLPMTGPPPDSDDAVEGADVGLG